MTAVITNTENLIIFYFIGAGVVTRSLDDDDAKV